jgi:hypothetical protein
VTTPEATADAVVAADGVAIDELTGFGRTDTEGALAAVEDVLAIPELAGFGRIATEGALGTAADVLVIAELPGFGRTEGTPVVVAEALDAEALVTAPVPTGTVSEGMAGAVVAPVATVSVLVAVGTIPMVNAIAVRSAGAAPLAAGVDATVALVDAALTTPADAVIMTSAVGSPSVPITVEAASAGGAGELGAAAGELGAAAAEVEAAVGAVPGRL